MRPFCPLLLAPLLLACGPQIHGNANIQGEDRLLPSFTSIRADDGLEVDVSPGTSQSVHVETDSNLLSHLETSLDSDGALLVKWPDHEAISPTHAVVRVVLPQLTALEASGTASLLATGLQQDQLSIRLSGGATVTARGQVGSLDADLSGGAQLTALELPVRNAHLEASGGAVGDLDVSDSLDASLSGGARIHLHRRPQHVHEQLSGASEIVIDP